MRLPAAYSSNLRITPRPVTASIFSDRYLRLHLLSILVFAAAFFPRHKESTSIDLWSTCDIGALSIPHLAYRGFGYKSSKVLASAWEAPFGENST